MLLFIEQGGAYGSSMNIDPFTKLCSMSSYRDPNLLRTVGAFDSVGRYDVVAHTHTHASRVSYLKYVLFDKSCVATVS